YTMPERRRKSNDLSPGPKRNRGTKRVLRWRVRLVGAFTSLTRQRRPAPHPRLRLGRGRRRGAFRASQKSTNRVQSARRGRRAPPGVARTAANGTTQAGGAESLRSPVAFPQVAVWRKCP